MAQLESPFYLAGQHVCAPQALPLPKVINLLTDRKEERDVGAYNSWVADPVVKIIGEFEASLKKYPPIKLTPDPSLRRCQLPGNLQLAPEVDGALCLLRVIRVVFGGAPDTSGLHPINGHY